MERLFRTKYLTFFSGVLLTVIATCAMFLMADPDGTPAVEFGDWAFWCSIFLGVSTGGLTVQKGVKTLKAGNGK